MQCEGCPKTFRMSARAKAFSVDALLGRTSSKHLQTDDKEDTRNVDAVVTCGALIETKCARAFGFEKIFDQSASLRSLTEENLKFDLVPCESDVRVELCGKDLWTQFHQIGNEMIITKAGRRMFPAMKVKIFGLDPDAYYILWVDVVPLDDNRYRYVYPSSQWMVAGTGDPPLHHTTYVHPDCPATGRHWLLQVVSFDRLKLTNNKQPVGKGQVSLHSMHKYHPRLHIQRTSDLQTDPELQIDPKKSLSFTFPETAFVTVTAYQNQQVTKLKIARNPFAKGFREAAKQREEKDHFESVRTNEHSFKYQVLSNPFPYLPHPYTSTPNVPFYCVDNCHVKPVIGATPFMHHHVGFPNYPSPPVSSLSCPPLTTEADRTATISFCSLPSCTLVPSTIHSRSSVVQMRPQLQGDLLTYSSERPHTT